jgi:hypothetical protein
MSFVVRRSERQRISTPLSSAGREKITLMSSQSSRASDGRTRPDESSSLSAGQMSSTSASQETKTRQRVLERCSESRLRVIASQVRKRKTVPDARHDAKIRGSKLEICPIWNSRLQPEGLENCAGLGHAWICRFVDDTDRITALETRNKPRMIPSEADDLPYTRVLACSISQR